MGPLFPLHWLVLGVIVLLLFAASWRGAARLGHRSRFFEGMNRTSAFALSGAMMLALSLLFDVYGAPLALGADGEDLSLGLAAAGAVFVVVSMILDRRSRNDPR